MNKKEQKILDDFMASCHEGNEGEVEFDQKPKVELDRDSVHRLTVESVVEGENQFGDYIGLATGEAMIFFGGYEAADIKRVVTGQETPFVIDVLRTQVASKKTEGRTFNKVHVKLV
tara:strand:+ start:773 stop:1120 length:348 start_codon:yes stop_codon:yes gene_type:complete